MRTQPQSCLLVVLFFSATALSGACSGQLGFGNSDGGAETSAPGGGTGPLAPDERSPQDIPSTDDCGTESGFDAGLTKLRRLTRTQLDNTLRDLLGVEADAASTLSPDERMGPFYSNAIAPVTNLQVQQYQELASRVALAASERMESISPCALSTDSGATCAGQLVDRLASRAYRRPLEAAERRNLMAIYEIGQSHGGPRHGFRLLIEALVQSPHFLYHADVGEGGSPSATPVPITPYGLAARLSYFLWNTVPDDELLDLVADGTLSEQSVLVAQVERMLNDPRAATTVASFHMQWLGLTSLIDVVKDPSMYPDFDEALVQEMIEETARFADFVVRGGDAQLSTLLTANFGFPGQRLLELYGVTPQAHFQPGDRVLLDPNQRSGILTLAGFLAKHAHGNQSSPVHRGMIVRENVLCQPIPPPPANVDGSPPPPTEISSTRERFLQHVADPSCANCHNLIDPPGLAFEHYDAIGAYRTIDGLGLVDATGEMIAVAEDLAGPFDGAIEFTAKLAQSDEVAECVSRQWFRFALGRVESESDTCSMHAIYEGFTASGGNIRSLLTQIVLSDAFRHVRTTAGEEN